MDAREYLRILRKNWVFIVAATLIGIAIAGTFAFLRTPMFEARSTVFVSTPTSGTNAELQQGSTFTQNRITTYTNLVRTPIVVDPVIDELGLTETDEELAERISGSNPAGTNLITITVVDPDPVSASTMANALADSLTAAVEVIETPAASTTSPVRLTNVAEAKVPTAPSSPIVPLYLALGALLGLIAGGAVVLLRSLLDTRIRNPRDLTSVSDRPIIGAIPMDSSVRSRPLTVHSDPLSPLAEAYRSLRTNLQFVEIDGAKTFVVTSSIPGEGKSTTTVNLAIALADAGQRVALIETDLRRPKLAAYLGVEGAVGLSDVLIGRADVADVMLPWGQRDLFVLTAGSIPPNPSEILGSRNMSTLLKELEREFDVILCDAPPLLPVTDAVIMSQLTAGSIMVVANGKTTRHQLEQALRSLETVGAPVVGLVATMTPTRGADAGLYYAYGYGYGPEDKPAS